MGIFSCGIYGICCPVPLGRDPSPSFRPSQTALPPCIPQGNKALLRAYKHKPLVFLDKAGYKTLISEGGYVAGCLVD